jgi:hypothetical protein
MSADEDARADAQASLFGLLLFYRTGDNSMPVIRRRKWMMLRGLQKGD